VAYSVDGKNQRNDTQGIYPEKVKAYGNAADIKKGLYLGGGRRIRLPLGLKG